MGTSEATPPKENRFATWLKKTFSWIKLLPHENVDSFWNQFAKWSVFAVVLALFPLGADACMLWFKDEVVTVARIIGHGQLILVSVALSGAALGDVLFTRKGLTWGRVLAFMATFLFFVGGLLLYPMAASDEPPPPAPTSLQALVTETKKPPYEDTAKAKKVAFASIIVMAGSFMSCVAVILTEDI